MPCIGLHNMLSVLAIWLFFFHLLNNVDNFLTFIARKCHVTKSVVQRMTMGLYLHRGQPIRRPMVVYRLFSLVSLQSVSHKQDVLVLLETLIC